ncbi:MAG: type II toxin-antitoxin system HicB family antitoxin [Treponematales bacterium]|jgi:predicted RNase H-like HicB family nuclease
MNLNYTYWEADGWFIGFLNDYPNQETQGRTLTELEDMLRSLYEDIERLEIPYLRHQGVLKIPA